MSDKTPTDSDTRASGALIADMPSDTRPREKALRHGIKSLTDIELMAIIFSTGVKGLSVLDLSRLILNDANGHLSDVAHMTPAQFCKRYKGIGPAKAITLLAALELGSRASSDAARKSTPQIHDSRSGYTIMKHRFENLDHEEFWLLMLSRSHKVIHDVRIGVGGVSATVVDIKILMRHVIDNCASSIIVCHNHPSGNLSPSPQDDSLTQKIKDAAKIFDVHVIDHLIICDNGYYSYADNGRL
ncbi:MAG: DNA repair protein RadC [Muribaculaceae bacterium]|nr:DNA repair protein RadC [Muribaculaceae bacterium]